VKRLLYIVNKRLPRFLKSLATTEIDSHFHGNDREGKKLITPTLVLPPQGGGDMGKRKDGLDESSPYIGKTKKIVLEKGKFRMFFSLNRFFFLRLLVFFADPDETIVWGDNCHIYRAANPGHISRISYDAIRKTLHC